MDHPKKVPFLLLSEDEQLLILKKLENNEIISISSTCSHANNLIERHKKLLSSRPQYGEPLGLVADDGFIDLEFHYRRFKAWDDFQEKIRAISFSRLEISILDDSSLPQLVDMLKNWRQSFPVVHLPDKIPQSSILELTNALTVSKWIVLPRYLDTNMLMGLKEAKNRGKFRIDLSREYYENHFDLIRNFGYIRMKATPETIIKFFSELHKAQCAGNLKTVTFYFIPPEENRESPFLLLRNHDLPPNTILIPAFPVSLYKLTLNNNMRALIKEQAESNRKRKIIVTFTDDSTEEIMDYTLKTLGVTSEFFTEIQRRQYLEINDQERVLLLKNAYDASRANQNSS